MARNGIKYKFSIITPSFNSKKFVESAIKSVLIQNYSDFEHIIIDGGSTDGTIEILKKYDHLRWISEPDNGQSDALNKGFKMATGDIIGWLNADDYYLPGAFDAVAKGFDEHNVDAIYGDFKFVDSAGKTLRYSRQIDFNKRLLIYRCYIPSTTFFFSRKIIDKGFFIDENLEYVMDKDFFLRLNKAGFKFKHIPVVLAAFRWHGDNKSISDPEKFYIESINIIKKYRPPVSRNAKLDDRFLKFQIYYYRVKHAFLKLARGKIIREKLDLLINKD